MCSLRQYHAPGTSRQEEYGYPEWGDKPSMKFPNDSTVHWNSVIMWTNKPEDDTDKDEQAPIRFTQISPPRNLLSLIVSRDFLPIVPHSCSWTLRTNERTLPGVRTWNPTRRETETTLWNCSRYHHSNVSSLSLYDYNSPSTPGGDHAQNGRDLRVRW